MKQINLLPPGILNHSQQRRVVPFYILVSLGAIIAILIPWWTVKSLTSNLSAQRLLREDAAKTVQEAANNEEKSRELSSLITRTKSVNILARQEVNWQSVFNLVSSSLPQDITLTNYNFSMTSGTPTLRFTGTAISSSAFAAFADFLKTKTEYTKVLVDGFNYDPSGGAVTFTITLNVKTNLILYAAK